MKWLNRLCIASASNIAIAFWQPCMMVWGFRVCSIVLVSRWHNIFCAVINKWKEALLNTLNQNLKCNVHLPWPWHSWHSLSVPQSNAHTVKFMLWRHFPYPHWIILRGIKKNYFADYFTWQWQTPDHHNYLPPISASQTVVIKWYDFRGQFMTFNMPLISFLQGHRSIQDNSWGSCFHCLVNSGISSISQWMTVIISHITT